MSNFIDKLANKIQGHDEKKRGQQQSSHDEDNSQFSSGKTRSGQQNLNDDNQFSTGQTEQQYSGQQQYGQQQYGQEQPSQFDSSQTRSRNYGSNEDSDFTGSRQQGGSSGLGNSDDDWNQGNLNTQSGGRETRSQYGARTQNLGQDLRNQGQQNDDDNYINRNL